MRPPPAARASGRIASGSVTSALRKGSGFQASQRILELIGNARELAARISDARHGRCLFLDDGAHLLRRGRIHFCAGGECLDLLRERLRLIPLRISRFDDSVDCVRSGGNFTIDLRERVRGRADHRFASGDAIARLEDLLLCPDGAGANLAGEAADLLERPGTLARELANFVCHDGEPLTMLAGARRFDGGVQGEKISLARDGSDNVGDLSDPARLFAQFHYGGNGLRRNGTDFGHCGERLSGGDRPATGGSLRDVRGRACLFGMTGNGDGAASHPTRRIGRLAHAAPLYGGGLSDVASCAGHLFRRCGHLMRTGSEFAGCARHLCRIPVEFLHQHAQPRDHPAERISKLTDLVVRLIDERGAELSSRHAVGLLGQCLDSLRDAACAEIPHGDGDDERDGGVLRQVRHRHASAGGDQEHSEREEDGAAGKRRQLEAHGKAIGGAQGKGGRRKDDRALTYAGFGQRGSKLRGEDGPRQAPGELCRDARGLYLTTSTEGDDMSLGGTGGTGGAVNGLMVSVSGIRGRVGGAFTPEVVARYAAAFGAWSLTQGISRQVVVGRDSRVSGAMFHRIVVGTLQLVGCDVIDIGLTTTPGCQLAVEHHRAAGGLMLSASHNPIEWNALKLIGSSGLFLQEGEGLAMRALVETGILYATWDRIGTVVVDGAAADRHIEAVLAIPYLDVPAIRARGFKVALDCVRGAGATIMPMLLERLGCEVIGINMEPDGRFPREPEPIPAHLGELERLVRDSGADVGLAVDPDVDRLALVSDAGKAIGEDYTLALAAKVVLKHRKGPVVTNLSTSALIDDVARGAGVESVRAPVGEVNVAVRMRELRSPIGGEGNGGVILPEVHLGRDAPIGAALLLQLMVEENRPLSAIAASLPTYVIVKDKLDRPNASLEEVYAALRTTFPDAKVDTQDGLRLTWPDRWVHVRPSGTEPIVRVIAEARDEIAARELVRRSREPLDALSR